MKTAWVGTGVMGGSMAGHLLDAGHELRICSRTPSKAQHLMDRGGCLCTTPAEAALGAELICIMVGFPAEVESVVFGHHGVLETAPPGSLLIDFTTSSPELARRIADTAADRGVEVLDAPVSGGDIGAREATLSIMVGGAEKAYQRALPVLECLGRKVVHQGMAGAGQQAKLCNQVLVAASMIGICEALLLARKSGLTPELVWESVRDGAAASWALTHLYPRILEGDLEAGFYVDHFVKDMGLALEECGRLNIRLPGLELVHKLYKRVQALGGGRKGTQALMLALNDFQENPL